MVVPEAMVGLTQILCCILPNKNISWERELFNAPCF